MTSEERRKREIEQRREAVINAANRLFYLKGYENVSMDEIASEAELSKTTLYTYFKDKESLFFVIVNRGIKILIDMIEKETQRQQSPGINAQVIKTAVVQFLIEYPNYAQAYLYFRSGKFNISNCNCMNQDAKEILDISKELLDQVILKLGYGIGNGTSKPDMNHVVTNVFYILVFEGILNGILNMDPIIREILGFYEISTQQFQTEALHLVQRLVIMHEGSTGLY